MPLHHADPGSRPGDAIPKRWTEDESPGPNPGTEVPSGAVAAPVRAPFPQTPFPQEALPTREGFPLRLSPSNLLLKVWTLRVLIPANRSRVETCVQARKGPCSSRPSLACAPASSAGQPPSGCICREASADMHLPDPSDSLCRSLTCPPIAQLSPYGEKNRPYRYGILTIFFAGCFRPCGNSAKPAVGPGKEKGI